MSNAPYKWAVAADLATNYTDNTLNQIATLAGSSFGHNARGNTDDDTVETYEFDADNRRFEAATATQGHVPLGRLYDVAAASTVKFLYDGVDVIGEYD